MLQMLEEEDHPDALQLEIGHQEEDGILKETSDTDQSHHPRDLIAERQVVHDRHHVIEKHCTEKIVNPPKKETATGSILGECNLIQLTI